MSIWVLLLVAAVFLLRWIFSPSKRSELISGTPAGNLIASSVVLAMSSIIALIFVFDGSSKFKTVATVVSLDQDLCAFFNSKEKAKSRQERGWALRLSRTPFDGAFDGYTLANCKDDAKIQKMIAEGWVAMDDNRLIRVSIKTEKGTDALSKMTLPTPQVLNLKLGDSLDVWAQPQTSYTAQGEKYFVNAIRYKINFVTVCSLVFALFGFGFFVVSLRKFRIAQRHPSSIT
jgi:muconolactone delta-isomerase